MSAGRHAGSRRGRRGELPEASPGLLPPGDVGKHRSGRRSGRPPRGLLGRFLEVLRGCVLPPRMIKRRR